MKRCKGLGSDYDVGGEERWKRVYGDEELGVCKE